MIKLGQGSGQVAFTGVASAGRQYSVSAAGQVIFSGSAAGTFFVSASGQVIFSQVKPSEATQFERYVDVGGLGTPPYAAMYWDMASHPPLLRSGATPQPS